MIEFLLIILIIINCYFFILLRQEQKRVRILTVFIDGIIRYSSKIPDMIYEVKENKDKKFDLELQSDGHNIIYKDIKESFLSSICFSAISSFVKNDKNLFSHNDFFNGFYSIYSNVFENVKNEVIKTRKEDEED